MKVTIGRMLRKKDASDGAMTPFQAVCTALAATVGTGNIVGVAGAIAIGGPGAVGSFFISMKKGVSRGIFSNEAGLGTGSIAHVCADTKKPVKQGFFGIFEVFIDTIVICTLTALVILCSGVPIGYGEAAGAELTILGFTSTYGSWVSIFTAVAMCCFAFSTIIGVFENIIASCMDKWGISRKKASLINGVIILIGSVPAVLGYNVWSSFQPRGAGSTVLDLEDFIVSNLLLPGGAVVFLLFCMTGWGWGFENYLSEVNTGKGLKMPRFLRGYLTYVMPCIMLVIIIMGLIG